MLSTSNSPSKQQYMTPRNTAVVTRPSLEKLRYTNNSTSNQIYDIFNSPFHTPSLFGTGTVTPSTLKNDANNDDYLDRYCCSREDFRFFQSTSPESLFNMMADIECSSSSSENTRAHSPKCDLFGESSSTMTVGDMLRPDYSTAATATTATATTPVGPPILYYPSQSKYDQAIFTDYSNPYTYNQHIVEEDNMYGTESIPNLRQQLKEANETIQTLMKRSNLLNNELEKNYQVSISLQAALTHKDAELEEKTQKFNMLNQLYEVQISKFHELIAEVGLYQTFIKSKGLDLPTIPTTTTTYPNCSSATAASTTSLLGATTETSDIFSGERGVTNEETSKATSDHSIPIRSMQSSIMTGRRSPAIHYHRSYDKQIDVDWTTMVDRITKDTDQQASIFMQQKLKSGSSDQKPFIFQAILEQSFALMINRFGNFLVQRQFELGTPEQIALLADTMRGHILQLTCEPFGCHVVQKALDYVEESTKAELVSELLTSISETITHKYACHVWQKIFEINWSPSASPPPIMECLHEALQGQWARIALDETGSLVIQNIFENKSEKDKRPILNEVLDNIASIAKGQWGNWVIQHILEQAERDEDRERAFEIVIKEAVQLSTDQFASKVVEKALRIGGNQFLARFIKRITTNTSIKHDTVSHTTPSQHRIGIMDIASDQYGNYVAQWLINNASEEQKLHISRLIKRHMVSLRGTKYGQRVAFLVEKVLRNQEITTYPKSN